MIANVLGFNLVDLIILVVVGISAVRGLRLGATIQLSSYIGFWLGLLAGAAVAPYLANLAPHGVLRTFIALVTLFGAASLTSAASRALGARVAHSVHRARLGSLDAGVGSVVSVIASLLIVWVVAALALNAPIPALAREVSGSEIVRALDDALPPAPSVFAQVDSLFSTEGFPTVFASIPPALAGPVNLPSQAEVNRIEAEVAPSLVKVEGLACGEIQEGSAFSVGPGYFVTNAHVVAGEQSTFLVLPTGAQIAASVILYDPHLDIAVLKATGYSAPALHFDTQVEPRGTEGVVLGYPEGGPLTYGSAGIMASFNAVGRDIYNQGLTSRLVYEIDAIVRPGNSGGPLVGLNGEVLGVVFSRSTTNQYVGFALAAPAVAQEVHDALSGPRQPVSTESCVP